MNILYMILLCIVVNVDRRSNTQPANTAGFKGDQLDMAKEKDACQDNARIDEFVLAEVELEEVKVLYMFLLYMVVNVD